MQLIFVSYAHKDRNAVQEFLEFLEPTLRGSTAVIWRDDERLQTGERWHDAIGEAIEQSAVGVMLVTSSFLRSKYILEQECPRLKAAMESGKLKLAWVHLKQAPYTREWFADLQAAHEADPPVWKPGAGKAHRARIISRICEEIRKLLPEEAKSTSAAPPSSHSAARSKMPRQFRESFPKTSGTLLGREELLRLLDRSWEDPRTNVLSLIAPGGAGKSALIAHWCGRLAAERFRGAERVFTWSFYGQGTGKRVTADTFLEAALKWFSPGAAVPATSFERGQLLAERIRDERTLLILDGLEPLQDLRENDPHRRIRDPGLEALLTSLASGLDGLCLISSRFPVAELEPYTQTAPRIEVAPLNATSGAQLLRSLGVDGNEETLQEIARRCGGHALTVELLGRFLSRVKGGDPAAAEAFFKADEEIDINLLSGPARRVMESYVSWFDDQSAGTSAHTQLLQLLGLFDRPAPDGSIAALCRPPIEGLSEGLESLSAGELQLRLRELVDVGLASMNSLVRRETVDGSTYQVDAHPLVRSYFAARLRSSNPEAWRAGHLRLYEHLRRHAAEKPKTSAEVAPLYAAVHHGCLAGRHEEAFNEVYWPRIHQGQKGQSHRWLGSNDSEVAMIGDFFEQRWTAPVANLSPRLKASVYGIASSRLRAQGELKIALRLARGSFEQYERSQEVQSAAGPEDAGGERKPVEVPLSVRSRHQAELLGALGELSEALRESERSLAFAIQSQEPETEIMARCVRGWILHQLGEADQATVEFEQAESRYASLSRASGGLPSLWGWRYGDLLIERGQWKEAQVRGERAVEQAREDLRRRDQADAPLTLGLLDLPLALLVRLQSDCARAEETGRTPDESGEALLEEARQRFRMASKREFLPMCDLAAARWHRLAGNHGQSEQSVQDALRLAEEMGMRLLEADCCLEWLRIERTWGGSRTRELLERVEEIIAETGYGRRAAALRAMQRR